MKQLFLLFGISAISLSAIAQQQNNHQHTGDRFGFSVFTGSHNIKLNKRADIGIYEKLTIHFPKWMIITDPWTGGFSELNGKPIATSGATLEEKAKNLMTNQLSVAGIKASDWVLTSTQPDHKGNTYLYFNQIVAGNKVVFSKMHFCFTSEGKIARIKMTDYGSPKGSISKGISETKALETATAELDGAIITNTAIEAEMYWFPIPSSEGYTLHPAYKFLVEGAMNESSSIPLNIFGYVDATDGTLLYRDNETKDAVDLKVVGSIFTKGYTAAPEVVGLSYVTGKVGTLVTLLANDTGLISSSTLFTPTTMTVSLEGPWSTVRSAPHSNAIPAFTKIITTSGTSDSFKTSSPSSSRHINAYYHVNTIHDFMKKQYGSLFTGMDYSLTTNVDVTGTCNAFYTAASGSSINFFPAGGGCVSFAEVRDVVYHEYGHAIVSRMYGGMNNGGLNEGQADVWAMSISQDSIMARNTSGPGTFIRRYDVAPKVFPFDLVGQVHADGEIIAGAWRDVAKNINSVDTMGQLFAKSLFFGKPDGANGTEGKVYFDFLIDALIQDDNDMDLSNGTPHFEAIVSAFARHGIYLLQDVTISHSELDHQPKATAINVNARLTVGNPLFFQNFNLVYRTNRIAGGTWTTVAMTDAGGFNFNATIPAQPEGTIVDYYFSAADLLSNEGTFFPYFYYPISRLAENKSNLYYQFAVGVSPIQKIDFEGTLSPDWKIGGTADNATAGNWIQAVPVGASNSGRVSQIGNDHTTGSGKCLVTGNAGAFSNAYTASVKNGKTTVTTPLFDLSTYTNPIVEYYRWFGNDRGRNPKKENWRVQMSTGTIFFLKDVDFTNQPDYQWRRRLFKPQELTPGATQMQLIFTATETPVTGSSQNGLVEALVDDFVIYEGKEGVTNIAESKGELAKIFPNPAVDILKIELPQNVSEASINFYDLTGKLISTVATTKGATKYAINTTDLAAGQYMLVVTMDKTIQTQKVTIAAK